MDDQSHERGDRVERDKLADQALLGAKTPVVHYAAKRTYVLQEVRRELVEKFEISVEAIEQPQPASTIHAAAPVEQAEPVTIPN